MARRILNFQFSIFNRATLLLAILVISYSSATYAQGIPGAVGGLELSASTNNPAPGQVVTVTAKSYGADISGATISWKVNGKTVQTGAGSVALQIQAPALGKSEEIGATATLANGTVLQNTITISSGSVDMIIEASGYVPPLFLGKLSPSYQNTVSVVAVPHIANASGVEYDPSTLIYLWKKNGQVLQDQSGYGKQSLTVDGDVVPRPYSVSVSVSSRDGAAQAQGTTEVTLQAPTISFYVSDPLYGTLFNQAVNGTVRIGAQKESSVLAVPFGFDRPSDGLGGLSLDWQVNSQSRPELSSSDSVVLRAPGEAAGSSQIGLQIRNSKSILQGADAGFTVMFYTNAAQSTATTF